MDEQRRQDLTSHIQESLELLSAFEEQRRLSDDPLEKRRAERKIAELRETLAAHRAELAALEQQTRTPTVPLEFVNRRNELRLLAPQRLRTSRSPYALVSAPAGYGKSYLLQYLVQSLHSDEVLRSRWRARYIDLNRPPGASISSIVAAIREPADQAPLDSTPGEVCNYIIQRLSAPLKEGRRAVLLVFDGVEQMNQETRQWSYALLQNLRKRTRPGQREIIVVRVILAGRDIVTWWQGFANTDPKPPPPQRITLRPFDAPAIQELIWHQTRSAQVELDDQTSAQIADEVGYLGGGHPAVIRNLVEELADQSFAVGPIADYFAQCREHLVKTCLAPIAEALLQDMQPEMRRLVRTLSVLRRLNANAVQILVSAGELPADINEIELLGKLQCANLLYGPGIREPFYQSSLMRRLWALDMAHRSPSRRARYQRLNQIALDLYQGWIHNLGQRLPDTPLKATQRLLSVVEWLFHALQVEELDQETLRDALQGHVRALSEVGQGLAVGELIADEIKRDKELSYLLRHRLGEKGLSQVCEWLQC